MKTLKRLGAAMAICMLAGCMCYAQKGTLIVSVKGIKEAKGNLMVAFGDQSNPKQIVYSMVPVTSTNAVTCTLKDVPTGSGGLYVYQDVNDNHQLDKDETQIPVEPCYQKERVTIKEGENKIEIKLIDVKEMMGTK
ncbi:MAG: DUF2141 domain-containing protein [Bacteroidota bacterium]|nr:DUF2141 domain-containing protein [Bacteroidota bacterium]